MKRLFIISFFLLHSSFLILAQAQKYAFYIDFDKKTINIDSLNLPQSVSAKTILKLLPELLERPGESLTDTYEIKVNGMTLGVIFDVALEQLRISDIEKIEVSESPISTYENNGQGGSINIVLRSTPLKRTDSETSETGDKSFWGSASLGFNYPVHIMPHVQLNYSSPVSEQGQSPKFSVQGIAFGEVYHGKPEFSLTGPTYTTTTNKDDRQDDQFLGAYLKYTPTAKDAFQLKITESYSNTKDDDVSSTTSSMIGDNNVILQYFSKSYFRDTLRVTQLRYLLNYKHFFAPNTKIEAEVGHTYSRTNTDSHDDIYLINNRVISNAISGTLNFSHRLWNVTASESRHASYGNIRVGCDYSLYSETTDYNEQKFTFRSANTYVNGNGKTKYLMPYINWECRFGGFTMQAQGELQTFHYRTEGPDSESEEYHHNNFTGSLIMGQKISKTGFLRLLYRRKLQRPSLLQSYGNDIVLPTEKLIIRGNSELLPEISDQISLEYISRLHYGQHNLTIDGNVAYNHMRDIITDHYQQLLGISWGDIGPSYKILYYRNDSRADVYSANLMLFYRFRSFTLSLTGNLYNKHFTEVQYPSINKQIETDNYNTSFNLSLMPAFDLPSGWNASLYIAYHSKVRNSDSELGDCALTQINIGKTIGRFDIYFYQKSAFTGDVTDVVYSNSGDISSKHPLVYATVGLGLKYQF